MSKTQTKPIDLYYWPTPNGWKPLIYLEELGIPYELKYVNIVDEIVRAARMIDFSDVRKLRTPSDGEKVSTVVVELAGGLKATYRIRQEDDAAWLSLEASGEGETAKVAEALNARAEGWEFRVPQSRVDEILKRREDLIEKVSS